MQRIFEKCKNSKWHAKTFLLLLLLCLVSTVWYQAKHWGLNREFNGVRWGGDIADYPDMLEAAHSEHGDFVVYIKSGDNTFRTLQTAPPKNIRYIFRSGRFHAAVASASSITSLDLLLELREKFGFSLTEIATMAHSLFHFRVVGLSPRLAWHFPAVTVEYIYSNVYPDNAVLFQHRTSRGTYQYWQPLLISND